MLKDHTLNIISILRQNHTVYQTAHIKSLTQLGRQMAWHACYSGADMSERI